MDINSTLLMGLVLLDEEAQDDRIRRKIRAARHRLFMKRQKEGCFQILVMKHLKDNNTKFIEYFRVNQEQFKHIVELVRGYIIKLPSKRHPKPISPEEKVAVTLRFLATGEAMRSLAFQFRISHNYMSLIIKTTLKAMCKSLVPIYLPSITTNILKQSAEGFLSKWNFPCCAAIDGKHVRIRNIPNSGSLYYNYKNYFSIVLLAVTDPDCKFLCVDIGSYGKESDSGIFAKSTIGKQILNGTFPFPSDIKLPGTDIFLPQFIVGDGGFKLTPRLMKPYPFVQSQEDTEKRQFNYRLSRARRTVESAFGILANVFRIFHSPIHMDPGTIDYLILAACCLHNMLINNKCASSNNCSDSDIPIPCENFRSLRRAGGTEITSAVNIRNELKSYMCSQQGRLTWQDNY